MVVRPERMAISDPSHSSSTAPFNSVAGTVVEERYLGATRLLKLTTPGEGGSLLVREDAWTADVRPVGAEVQVCWSPADSVWVEPGNGPVAQPGEEG